MTASTITRERDALKALEVRVEELLILVEQLQEENRDLKRQRVGWMHERERLLDKNQQARHKVAGILNRIKVLEQVRE